MTLCEQCGKWVSPGHHACRVEGVHARILRVLEGADAHFAVAYRHGGYVHYGVERFPDVRVFTRLLEEEGLGAAYSAGTGWSFTDERADVG